MQKIYDYFKEIQALDVSKYEIRHDLKVSYENGIIKTEDYDCIDFFFKFGDSVYWVGQDDETDRFMKFDSEDEVINVFKTARDNVMDALENNEWEDFEL